MSLLLMPVTVYYAFIILFHGIARPVLLNSRSPPNIKAIYERNKNAKLKNQYHL